MDATVRQSFWTDDRIEDQSAEIKLAALWCITNPSRDLCGFTRVSNKRFTFETSLTPSSLQGVCKALPSSFQAPSEGVIFATHFLRHQFGKGGQLSPRNKVIVAAIRHAQALPIPLARAFFQAYPELLQNDPPHDPPSKGDTQIPQGVIAKHKHSIAKKDSSDSSSSEITPETIYQAYPRKVAKPDALRAIEKTMRRVTPAYLLERTQAFASAVADVERQFIPHPATWFNGERYDDDESEWNPEIPAKPATATPAGEGAGIPDVVALYPRRQNVMAACQALDSHLRKDSSLTLDIVADGTRAIAAVIRELPGGHLNAFVPTAERFFRDRRWEDDPLTWLRQASTSGAPVSLSLGGRRAAETIHIGSSH